MDVFEKIREQQKGLEGTAVWMLGEQLAEICRREPESLVLVERDLEQKGMGLSDCEKKIKAYADAHRPKGAHSACVPPDAAEEIIRAFYGLPAVSAVRAEPSQTPAGGRLIDLADFL